MVGKARLPRRRYAIVKILLMASNVVSGCRVTLERIKRKHFRKPSYTAEYKITLCQRYLNDAVLRENRLSLTDDDRLLQDIKAVRKEIHFDYYERQPETVTAIECPVMKNNRPEMLYVAGMGRVENSFDTQYFVMAHKSPNEGSKLTVLMRTVTVEEQHLQQRTDIEISEDEAEFISDDPNRGAFRLMVRRRWYSDNFRLFGKDAERAYITTRYGFVNLSYNQNVVDQFVVMVEKLKKGSYPLSTYVQYVSQK